MLHTLLIIILIPFAIWALFNILQWIGIFLILIIALIMKLLGKD